MCLPFAPRASRARQAVTTNTQSGARRRATSGYLLGRFTHRAIRRPTVSHHVPNRFEVIMHSTETKDTLDSLWRNMCSIVGFLVRDRFQAMPISVQNVPKNDDSQDAEPFLSSGLTAVGNSNDASDGCRVIERCSPESVATVPAFGDHPSTVSSIAHFLMAMGPPIDCRLNCLQQLGQPLGGHKVPISVLHGRWPRLCTTLPAKVCRPIQKS